MNMDFRKAEHEMNSVGRRGVEQKGTSIIYINYEKQNYYKLSMRAS